jgi:GcrA cell cycle regulator
VSEKFDWTEADRLLLADLWGQGLSASAIGLRMGGRSKNSILGAVHRMNLPGRASPIAAKGSGAPQLRRQPMPGVPRARGEQVLGGPTLVALGLMPAVAAVPVAVEPKPGVASRPCCWPMGDPKARDFRFCEGAGVLGRPYCAEHHALAYVAPVERSAANVAADEARRAAAHARMAASGGFSVGGFRPEWTV